MTDPPHISVLMPVYNCEQYVHDAVKSILNQSYTNYELLIVDDASTDTTVSIIKSFTDSRIQLIEKPKNTGYTNSLNQGIFMCKGKYIARMDGDDISLPERFAKQVEFMDANPEVVVCGTTYKYFGNPKTITIPETHDAIKIGLLWGNCLAHPSVMIRKEALHQFSTPYDTNKEPAEDYDLWVKLLNVGKLHNLPETLIEYRTYSLQVSRKRAEEQRINDVETRFKIHNYLNIEWTTIEREFLERYFKRTEAIKFEELDVFKQIQNKLADANHTGFFESHLFKQYLIDLEIDVLRKCFLKQTRYTPLLYFEYLKSKLEYGAKLPLKRELKLGLKSLFFWTTMRP